MELPYTPVRGYVEGRQLYYKIKTSKRRNGALTRCRHGDSGAASREHVLAAPGQFMQSWPLPSTPLPGTCPGDVKTGPHRDLYTKVHSSVIHNVPQMETTQMFTS